MPSKPLVLTDHVTLEIPAFDLGEGFTCSGTGLYYQKHKFMQAKELRQGLVPGAKLKDPLQRLFK